MVHDRAGYKHVLLQTNISHKLENKMKFREILISDIEEIFLEICGNMSLVS
jgi:hypothetical protein